MRPEHDEIVQKWPIGFDKPPTILLVDDEPNILNSMRRLLRPMSYELILANNGEEALHCMEEKAIDLVISDMRMPGMDGAHLLGHIQERWPDTIRILLTGYSDFSSTVAAINLGHIYRYLSKPWNDEEMLLTVKQALEQRGLYKEHKRLSRLTDEQNQELKMMNVLLEERVKVRTEELSHAHEKLKRSFMMSIKIFSNLIEMRSDYQNTHQIRGHAKRVAELARKIAEKMGLPRAHIQDIMLAGLLHDIGRIGFSDELMTKPFSQLNEDEWKILKSHPIKGAYALSPLEELKGTAIIIKHQHERYDGYGFPDGLSGEAIPIASRILSIVIDYDAAQLGLRLNQKLSVEEAKDWILKGAVTRYDPTCVDAFMHIIGEPSALSHQHSTKKLLSHELQEGMVLAQDIVLSDGLVWLEAGHILDALWIKQIKRLEKNENITFSIQVCI